jgi:hypothetical protein
MHRGEAPGITRQTGAAIAQIGVPISKLKKPTALIIVFLTSSRHLDS